VAYIDRLPTEIIAIAHDQMNHYRMRHELYSKVNLKLPEKTYPVGFLPETQRQATQHACLPRLLGDGD
jgi:hypothetical protein